MVENQSLYIQRWLHYPVRKEKSTPAVLVIPQSLFRLETNYNSAMGVQLARLNVREKI